MKCMDIQRWRVVLIPVAYIQWQWSECAKDYETKNDNRTEKEADGGVRWVLIALWQHQFTKGGSVQEQENERDQKVVAMDFILMMESICLYSCLSNVVFTMQLKKQLLTDR